MSQVGEFSISRVVDASPARVYRAYLDPEEFVQFWSPEGVTIAIDTVVIEPWVGGRFECTMVVEAMDNLELPNVGTFVEIVENERLVFCEASLGNLISTMTFTGVGDGQTRITVFQVNVPVEYLGQQATDGFNSCFDKLERLLAQG
ncbi:unannotated protein [freshwater metagenome]|uniref:Unannotated protein n=1 Tax=freshwater metagenome TaxID=449393 RepID=A0A6J6IFX8_9ZZZZ|nr:hypothetical protein [Actinomycetota bacterium]